MAFLFYYPATQLFYNGPGGTGGTAVPMSADTSNMVAMVAYITSPSCQTT